MMIAKKAVAAKAGELNGYVDQLSDLIVKAIDEHMPLHEVEEQTFRVLLKLGRETLQLLFDLLGPGDVGENCTLPNGRTVKRLDEQHSRPYQSIFGEFELERFVYGCGKGRKIELIPLDARLALPENKFSYLLQDWDQSLATEEPFAKVSGVIKKILGLQQHVDSLERMNRDMSETVSDFHMTQTAPPPAEEAEILVQTADGKGVPIRRPADAPAIHEHRSKSGPKPDRKKMAILGSVYSIDPHVRTPEEVVESLFRQPGETRPKSDRPHPQHKRVRAVLNHETAEGDPIRASAAVFGWMADEVTARNPQGEKPVVCVMDGQESLWEERDVFQDDQTTIDVLDLLHVTPRVWQAAHLFYPVGSDAAEQFVRQRVLRILRGEVGSVIRGLRCMGTAHRLQGAKENNLAKICNYLEKNQHRMRYDEYLARGYPIASGVIEGACRHVVKDRLERTGMTWTVDGAQAMLQLRCIHLSDEWDNFTTFRFEKETKRLYPYRESMNEKTWALAT